MNGPNPPRFPSDQRKEAGHLISGGMRYGKPAISINAQLSQLKSRGMGVPNHKEAKHFLRTVGYYRLAGYWWTMQHDTVGHRFRTGSSFDQVLQRYNFDRELRLVALNMIERVEIGLRTQMIYHLSMAYGPFWFEHNSLAKNERNFQLNLKKVSSEVKRSKERFIIEHNRKYASDNRLPPAWKSLEVISFGTLSKIYRNISDGLPEKGNIAHNLALPNHLILSNWLYAIALLRNVVAHHSRLFQRSMEIRPRLPKTLANPWIDTNSLNTKDVFAHLCCLQYLLATISPGNRFKHRIDGLFSSYPLVREKEVGFPANWKNQPLWKAS